LREAAMFVGTRRSLSPSQDLRARRANMIFRRRHTLPRKGFKFTANISDELINARTI
jgi:hypothetical protein